MKNLILKDRRQRILYSIYERRHNVLQSIVQNLTLVSKIRLQAYRTLISLPRECIHSRIRNRCSLTGRSRGIYREFGRSRLRFRKLALEGKLSGVKKSS